MQSDPELLDALRTDLAELTALHAPSGCEQPVIARLRELFAPLVETIAADHMGNLTATREGLPGAPHLVVSAHADEIGALVASVEPEGFLRLLPIGGVQPRLLEGRAVWVGGKTGVIGARSGHLTPRSEQGQGLVFADLYVDLGVDSAAEVEALGVGVGDPVVVLSELRRLAGTRVAGKGIDNRASCVLLLHLLRRLQGQPLPCRLSALVTVQEEVGLRGAQVAFTRLRPDLAIVVDTFPSAGTPDTRGLTYTARIGQGVLITPASSSANEGFLLPRAVHDAVIAAARRVGVPYQLAVTGSGVTDAAAAHLAGEGIITFEVKLPRRYSHSPVEMLDLRDLVAALALVEELVIHPPAAEELAFLRNGEHSYWLITTEIVLHLRGVQGYEGHLQHVHDPEERAQRCCQAMYLLTGPAAQLRADGFAIDIVITGGTGTAEICASCEGVTEAQPGSFVFMDTDYRNAIGPVDANALTLLSTVISRPAPTWVVVDAGLKSLSTDSGMPEPKDLHDVYYAHREGKLEAIWLVKARGKVQ